MAVCEICGRKVKKKHLRDMDGAGLACVECIEDTAEEFGDDSRKLWNIAKDLRRAGA